MRRIACALFIATVIVGRLPKASAEDAPPAPVAVAAAPDGSIYYADRAQRAVLKRDAAGKIEAIARAGPADRTPLRALRALVIEPDGAVLAADSATRDIYRLRAGQPPQPLTAGRLEIPTGIALDKDGTIIVCDLRLNVVFRVPKAGGSPEELARVIAPRGVAVGPSGEIVVLSSGPDALVRIAPDGKTEAIVKGRKFHFPLALLRNGSGYLVSDGDAATIWSVSDKGEVQPFHKGAPLVRPEGLARDGEGRVLVADPRSGQIVRIAPGGQTESLLKAP